MVIGYSCFYPINKKKGVSGKGQEGLRRAASAKKNYLFVVESGIGFTIRRKDYGTILAK
jgi:hypothetical protein